MAHKLFPLNDGEYLSPRDVAVRLRAEFDRVEVDVDGANDYVLKMIQQFERMNVPKDVIEARMAMLGKSISITVADREDYDDDHLRFTVMPNEPLLIGYYSRKHQNAAAPFLERVCKAIRYRSELV